MLTVTACAAEPATQPVNPMEQLASPDAVHAALGDAPMTLFTESRDRPIRRFDRLPTDWLTRPADQRAVFHGRPQPGEYYVFQLAICAGPKDVGPLQFVCSGLSRDQASIDANRIHCINLGGVGPDGRWFDKKDLIVPAGHVQPLWIAVDVPRDARRNFAGTMSIYVPGGGHVDAAVDLDIEGEVLHDDGVTDPNRLARLKWLDSTVGSAPVVTKPFTPVGMKGDLLSVLGRDVLLDPTGFPAKITSHFSGSNTHLVPQGTELLAGPATFNVKTDAGPIGWKSKPGSRFTSDVAVNWMSLNSSPDMDCDVRGQLEFDGMLSIDAVVTAHKSVDCTDLNFQLPLRAQTAKYLMGLGIHGGLRPAELKWKWNADKFQDAVWIGDVNAGIQLRFKGENYQRPLVNIYYPFRELNVPESWGTGGIDVLPEGNDRVVLRAYTGPRKLEAGKPLHFKIEMYLTPFKLLNTEQHWGDRFIHPFEGSGQKVIDKVLTELKPDGPNIVEIHHATYTNPYINYPYNSDSLATLEKFIGQVHDLKARAMVYYTTRELTINMPEIWALHSLNGEVIFPGPGADSKTVVNPKGPHPWLTEHLRDAFIPAWRTTIGSPYNKLDLSVITTPDSRWNNFYLEGLKFLCDRAGIDGIYVDDTALDHRSLQRARRILDTAPGRLIDLHSWNHNNSKAHDSNSAMVYMELFPYIDRLWLGEGFDCNKVSPDYWLIEMSGIPYGLMADMLQNGGNVWLGMLYGETPKLGWGKSDPRPMWKLWDEFGMADAEMIGYWDPACPVHTDDPNVLATVYRRKDRTLISLGNFSDKPAAVHLTIDRAALNLSDGELQMVSQLPDATHPSASDSPTDELKMGGKDGMLLVISAK